MNYDKAKVRSKLDSFRCPQGQCITVIKKMVDTLGGGTWGLTQNVPLNTLDDVLKEIRSAIKDNRMIVLWFNSGYKDIQIPAWHSCLVYSVNPIKSIIPWENNVEYCDEIRTKELISKTINSVKHNRVITVHQYQRKVA